MSSWSADQMSQANRRRPVPCHKGGSSECSPVTTLGACCFLSETAGARCLFRGCFKMLGEARLFMLWPGGAGMMAVEREMWPEWRKATWTCSQVPWSENTAQFKHTACRNGGAVPASESKIQYSNAARGEGPKGRGLKQRHSLQNDRKS